jgi:hypothetical protein
LGEKRRHRFDEPGSPRVRRTYGRAMVQRTHGSIHAGWVLEGRAIQDVFAVPGLFYGTSLRFYDPRIDAWQVFWSDPLKEVFFGMIGRARGKECFTRRVNS